MNDAPLKPTRKAIGGALADGLTLVRVILMPIVVALIITGWPDIQTALIASVLFAIAAITDIIDDLIGGPETAPERAFGWFDDIADLILVIGSLLGMSYIFFRAGGLGPWLAIPVGVIVARELLIGLLRGYELSRTGWPSTKLGNLKTILYMLATCILIASPWLTPLYDTVRADPNNIMDVYAAPTTVIWQIGQGLLWLAALVSVVTGVQLLRTPGIANDS